MIMELPKMILKYCAFMVFLPVILSQNYDLEEELIVCKVPDGFQMQESDYHRIEIYGTELLIRYKEISMYLYPGTNSVSILLNGTSIDFQAYMKSAYYVNNEPLAERIWWTSNGFITGLGQLQKINEGHYRGQQYRFCLPTNSTASPSMFEAVENEVRRLTRLCVETEVSEKTYNISEKSLKRFEKIDDFGPVIISSQLFNHSNHIPSKEIISPAFVHTDSFGFNINDLVDLGLGATIDMMKAYNLDKIKLPDLNKTFSSDMKILNIKGYLQASNGTFTGLASLMRTADVVLFRQGHKYKASCGFGMTNATVQYNKYKFQYGFMELCGSIIVRIASIALESNISVDYNAPKCVTKLESVKITEFGRMKVNFTGTSVMNTIGSKFINWFTKLFKNNFKGLFERDLEAFLADRLSSFDCERYRKKLH